MTGYLRGLYNRSEKESDINNRIQVDAANGNAI